VEEKSQRPHMVLQYKASTILTICLINLSIQCDLKRSTQANKVGDEQPAIRREVEREDLTSMSFESIPYEFRLYFPGL